MKEKKELKKLTLTKTTIANLKADEMDDVKGGLTITTLAGVTCNTCLCATTIYSVIPWCWQTL